MPRGRPRTKHAIVSNHRQQDLAALASAIIAPKQKNARKTSTKKNAKRPPLLVSESSSDSETGVQPSQSTRSSQKLPSINVEEQEYTVSCTAFYDDKKVWFDVNVCRLRSFKVHDFNAKSIVAVTKEAERLKTGFELASCVVTISATRLKQCAKMLEDPNDWQSVEKMIESYMKEGYKNLRVDYIVNYLKMRKQVVVDSIDDDESNDTLSIQTGKPTIKKRKVSHL
jgi:hypothetical protein